MGEKMRNTIKAQKSYSFFELSKNQIIIGLIILPFYLGILKYLILEPIMNLIINDQELVNYWVNPLRNIIILVAYVILLKKNIMFSLQDFAKGKAKENIVWILKGCLFFGIARAVYALIVVAMRFAMGDKFTVLFGAGPQNESVLSDLAAKFPVLLIILAVVLSPILEELVFRYVLYHSLRRINKYLAMIVVCIVFSGVHVLNEMVSGQFIQAAFYMLSYLTIAVPLVILYEKRRNIVFCIILHALNNMLAQFS